MKRDFYRLFLTAALALSGWATTVAQNTEVAVNKSSGSWTATNPAGTWARTWTSTQDSPTVTLSCTSNNMDYYDGENIRVFTGNASANFASTYTLSVSVGYEIVGYKFDFTSDQDGKTIVVTPSGKASVSNSSSTTPANISVTDIHQTSITFNVKEEQQKVHGFARTQNFVVTVAKNDAQLNKYLFITNPGEIPYRIPAMACTPSGKLLAFSDYRPCRSDIGYGEVDIQLRISSDNGKTWGKAATIADGTGNVNALDCGFGDAAVVADRESEQVLMLCVAGKTPYGQANYFEGRPNPMVRFVSNDGGQNWDTYTDLTEQVYSMFKTAPGVGIKSLFVGSGKLCQSTTIKKGTHYRIYAPLCARDGGNRVIFSDDFGLTWKALGGVEARPVPAGDEPKCEELPDGRILISSRANGGRLFNIFTYSDETTGAGTWSNAVMSGASNNGTVAQSNACNGEIMILPVKRNADQKQMYLALQSVPFGPGRTNVGIHFKALESIADYITPTAFAANWTGHKQISQLSSAYSTMILQKDNKIAFFYEESTFGADYTNVYQAFTLEEITDDAFSYDPTVPKPNDDDQAISAADLQRAERLLSFKGLGYPAADAPSRTQLIEIINSPATHTKAQLMTAIENLLGETKIEMPQNGTSYTFTFVGKDKQYYLIYTGSDIALGERNADDIPAQGRFTAHTTADGRFFFTTADGKHLCNHSKRAGVTWLENESTTGFTDTFDPAMSPLTLEKAPLGTNMTNGTLEDLYGHFVIRSMRGINKNSSAAEDGYWIVNTENLDYDGAGTPYWKDNFSSVIRLEQAKLSLGELITSLDKIENNKAYVLHNPHFNAYAIKKEGENNVWVAEMQGDSDHPLNNPEFAKPLDILSPLSSWQIIKTDNGDFYLYNIGAKQFAQTPDNISACTFTDEQTPIHVVQRSLGFAFNTGSNALTYFCAAPQLAQSPIAVWAADDAGSKWVLYENPNIAADAEVLKNITALPQSVPTPTLAPKGIYNLAGRLLPEVDPTRLPQGIYIINGRKRVVK